MVEPFAIQDNLAKTPLAERVNQLQKTAPELDQKQAAIVVKEQHIQKQREAVPTEKTDEAVIHRDKQGQQQQHKEKHKKKDENQEETKPSGLDVTA